MKKTSPVLPDALHILERLIAFPTISADSNLQLIDYVEALISPHLAGKACRIERSYDETSQKANILISLPDVSGGYQGGLMFSGHTDVVPVAGQQWSKDPFQAWQCDDKLYGRGSCDMKGFIAAALAAFPAFACSQLKRPIHFAFSYDEEVGCLGARGLVQQMQKLHLVPDITIVGEPTEMGLIEGHKGVCEYRTHFHGLAGHASMPHLGVSAVEYAVEYASCLLALRKCLIERAPSNSRFDPKYTTLQVGQFHSGIACNVIADQGFLEWDVRPIQNEDALFVNKQIDQFAEEHLLPRMQSVYPKASIHKEVMCEVEGLVPIDKNEAISYLQALTGNTEIGVVSYGTEAGLFQQMGSACVVCGPGSIRQAHRADEFLSVEQLDQCLSLFHQLQERNAL